MEEEHLAPSEFRDPNAVFGFRILTTCRKAATNTAAAISTCSSSLSSRAGLLHPYDLQIGPGLSPGATIHCAASWPAGGPPASRGHVDERSTPSQPLDDVIWKKAGGN